jgi:hypothetical protein
MGVRLATDGLPLSVARRLPANIGWIHPRSSSSIRGFVAPFNEVWHNPGMRVPAAKYLHRFFVSHRVNVQKVRCLSTSNRPPRKPVARTVWRWARNVIHKNAGKYTNDRTRRRVTEANIGISPPCGRLQQPMMDASLLHFLETCDKFLRQALFRLRPQQPRAGAGVLLHIH